MHVQSAVQSGMVSRVIQYVLRRVSKRGPASCGPSWQSGPGYFLSGRAMVSRIDVSAMMFFIL